MKINCQCGAVIHNSTDDLPGKAHLIPDQAWCTMWDAIDQVLSAVANGSQTPEVASMKARKIVRNAGTRFMWQCGACGRLYIDDRRGGLQCFLPATKETDVEILRHVPYDDDR